MFPANKEDLVRVAYQVSVSVDPTDEALVDAVRGKRDGSIETVVAQEIQSNLESVSYVKEVRVIAHMKEVMTMTVKFVPNDKGNPPGKLADAELHFSGGPLDGLKLVGFGVWERKQGGRNVTFPARQYSVNGERRSYALLRPIVDAMSQDMLRDLILDAFKEHESEMAAAG